MLLIISGSAGAGCKGAAEPVSHEQQQCAAAAAPASAPAAAAEGEASVLGEPECTVRAAGHAGVGPPAALGADALPASDGDAF